VQAAEWLANAQPSDHRAQDVIRIIVLHIDYLKTFEVARESRNEDDWTEEDDAEFGEIVKEVDALADLDYPDLGEEDGEVSEVGSGDDRSEESEGEEP
jgi:hypothetical protein